LSCGSITRTAFRGSFFGTALFYILGDPSKPHGFKFLQTFRGQAFVGMHHFLTRIILGSSQSLVLNSLKKSVLEEKEEQRD
jgi:hypothetical protein